MKTLVLLTLLTIGSLCTAIAQGTVNFIFPPGVYVTNIMTGQRVPVGTTFKAALYYAPDVYETIPDQSAFIQVGASANFGPLAGMVIAGRRTTTATPGGGAAWFQVRAWEAAFGSTYEQAMQAPTIGGRLAAAGTSNIIKIVTGDPTSIPPLNPPANLVGLQSFYVGMPEPAFASFLFLGAAAFWLVRRRAPISIAPRSSRKLNPPSLP